MSIDLTEDTITEAVQRSFDTSTDERFRQLFVCLVQHLHKFAREVRLTGEEWLTAMDFLDDWAPGVPASIAGKPLRRSVFRGDRAPTDDYFINRKLYPNVDFYKSRRTRLHQRRFPPTSCDQCHSGGRYDHHNYSFTMVV